jgi:hypothetical protein
MFPLLVLGYLVQYLQSILGILLANLSANTPPPSFTLTNKVLSYNYLAPDGGSRELSTTRTATCTQMDWFVENHHLVVVVLYIQLLFDQKVGRFELKR